MDLPDMEPREVTLNPNSASTPTTGNLNLFERSDSQSAKRKKRSSQELLESSELSDIEHNIVLLIEDKLKNLEKLQKLDMLDTLLSEVAELKTMVNTFKVKANETEKAVLVLQTEMNTIKTENRLLKETLLDLQTRSMSNNLIFNGIPEGNEENPEGTLKAFMENELKIPRETVTNISFARVHRIGKKKTYANAVRSAVTPAPLSEQTQPSSDTSNTEPHKSTGPRPIVAKFEFFKQRDYVKRLGKRLKGKPFGMNEQFPATILERRKALLPIYRKMRQEGHWVSLIADKLYIDNRLFKDPNITYWL